MKKYELFELPYGVGPPSFREIDGIRQEVEVVHSWSEDWKEYYLVRWVNCSKESEKK